MRNLNTIPSVSVLLPCFNEERNIELLYNKLLPIVKKYNYKIIFIDDGSSDSTLSQIKCISKMNSNVFYLKLSRNFGHQMALKAGYDYSDADCTICLDCDLQHPISLIEEMIIKWKEGYDVVYSIRKSTAGISFFKKTFSIYFYRIFNYFSNTKIHANSADFRLIDKKVLTVLQDIKENDIFLRGMIPWLGFSQYALHYDADKRETGESKFSLSKMLKLSLNGIASFSTIPLRISTTIGIILSILSMLYLVYIIIAYMKHETVAGWASIMACLLFLMGLQFIMMGILGEYIGKIFMQSKHRPSYIVSENNMDANAKIKDQYIVN